MNQFKEKKLILIILFIAIIAILILVSQSKVKAIDPTTKCIIEKSELYVQTGCPACTHQKQLLGEDYESFNPIDCRYKQQECFEAEIRSIPTWIINNEKHTGAKTIVIRSIKPRIIIRNNFLLFM